MKNGGHVSGIEPRLGLSAAKVKSRDQKAIELGLLALIALALLRDVISFGRAGYFAPPFFSDPDDTFMDWFNVAYWAHKGGEYTAWRSVYPPLAFAFTKLFSLSGCYTYDPFVGRDCDWLARVLIAALFLINLCVSFFCFRVRDRGTAAVRALALGFGLPMLYAVERGNLSLVAFGCFAIAWADTHQSSRIRRFWLATAVNFKPYLAVTMAAYLVRRQWLTFDRCVWAILLIWLASFVIVGSGTPGQLLVNQILWLKTNWRSFYEPVQNATSYSSLLSYLHQAGEVRRMIGEGTVTALSLGLKTLMWGSGLCATSVLILVGVARAEVPIFRLAALSLSVALTATDAGGYAAMFLIFLVFLENWERPETIVALVAAYLLCVPFDIELLQLGHWTRFSYLGDRSVSMPQPIGVGALIRPGLVSTIQIALTACVYGDIRKVRCRREVAK